MMVNFSIFAFAASALSLVVVDSRIPIASQRSFLVPQDQSAYESLEPIGDVPTPTLAKRGLFDLPSSIISELLPVRRLQTPQRVEQRTSARVSFKQISIHAHLTACLNAILPHTQVIRRLCTGSTIPDAEQLSWKLVAELRAILDILNGALTKVKDCGTAPTPSGTPGGSYPTLMDICQIFFKIMCEIRECCKLIGSLCIKYRVVRRVCRDTLMQITGCLSSIVIRCGIEVGDVFTGLGHLFGTIPNFFVDVQFGFNAIPVTLGNSNSFFNFQAFF